MNAMGRSRRVAEAGYAYHVLNRANAQMTIFEDERRLRSIRESPRRSGRAIGNAAISLLHNAQPLAPDRLAQGRRRAVAICRMVDADSYATLACIPQSIGSGHVYQGRFKSFPIQEDDHFYTVARYVERNALCGGSDASGGELAVEQSAPLAARVCRGQRTLGAVAAPPAAKLGRPRERSANGIRAAAVRRSARRGCPFGDEAMDRSGGSRIGHRIDTPSTWPPWQKGV